VSQGCIFCKIVAGEMSSSFIYQDDEVTAFKDINPQAPSHILIVPNKHIGSVGDASGEDQAVLGKLLLAAAQIAQEKGVANRGYRLVINTGVDGGQSVSHLHVHLLAGRQMSWPPG